MGVGFGGPMEGMLSFPVISRIAFRGLFLDYDKTMDISIFSQRFYGTSLFYTSAMGSVMFRQLPCISKILELWIHSHPNELRKKKKRPWFGPWRWLGSELIPKFFKKFVLLYPKAFPSPGCGPRKWLCGLSRKHLPCMNVNTLD